MSTTTCDIRRGAYLAAEGGGETSVHQDGAAAQSADHTLDVA